MARTQQNADNQVNDQPGGITRPKRKYHRRNTTRAAGGGGTRARSSGGFFACPMWGSATEIANATIQLNRGLQRGQGLQQPAATTL